MQDETVEDWIRKAEGDFRTANRELQIKDFPNYDAVCYHSQQCAEKYLKAYLISQHQIYPKNHKLIELLNICLTLDSSFEFIRQELETLNGLDILRYPYDFAIMEDAELAFHQATTIRRVLRKKLNFRK